MSTPLSGKYVQNGPDYTFTCTFFSSEFPLGVHINKGIRLNQQPESSNTCQGLPQEARFFSSQNENAEKLEKFPRNTDHNCGKDSACDKTILLSSARNRKTTLAENPCKNDPLGTANSNTLATHPTVPLTKKSISVPYAVRHLLSHII